MKIEVGCIINHCKKNMKIFTFYLFLDPHNILHIIYQRQNFGFDNFQIYLTVCMGNGKWKISALQNIVIFRNIYTRNVTYQSRFIFE